MKPSNSHALDLFNSFLVCLKQTPLWINMVLTRENSKWHREANVGVHTSMVLDWYLENLADARSEHQRMITSLACVFHDVGKPECEKQVEKDGVVRNVYHGHEAVSAAMWRRFAAENPSVVEHLRLSEDDLKLVELMIKKHLPFDIVKVKKREALKAQIMSFGEHAHRAWLDLLCADQFGRVSDDSSTKIAKLEQWLIDWDSVKSDQLP